MKKVLLALIFGLLTMPVFADSINLLAGYVVPNGDSDVFTQNKIETTFDVGDLEDFGGTISYSHFLGEYINLDAGFSYYESHTTVSDVEFEFDDGSSIVRDISLRIVPLEASLHVLPIGREAAIIPYAGGGFGAYYWEYEEFGDFVQDRNSPNPTPVHGGAFSDGTDFGWHVEGGIMIPVSRAMTINAEVKYWDVKGDLDEIGFDPRFEPLDLSATMYSGGVSFWF